MSIATRPPGPDLAARSRNSGEVRIGISRPPTELLPDGGNLAPAPAPAAERVLARDALRLIRLIRLLRSTGFAPVPWFGGDLSHEVEVVRRQLDPIRSRRSLAASYRREAFHHRDAGIEDTRSRGAVARLAYALRWLELGPDRS